MKGDERILNALNDRMAEALTAINQLLFHAKLCENWGYERLHSGIRAQAMDEMNHAEWLIERIIFLEGIPSVLQLNSIKFGDSVEEMIDINCEDALNAITHYNESTRLAVQCGDHGTSALLMKILSSEERHLDWNESQRNQIAQMGLANYLMNQANEFDRPNNVQRMAQAAR